MVLLKSKVNTLFSGIYKSLFNDLYLIRTMLLPEYLTLCKILQSQMRIIMPNPNALKKQYGQAIVYVLVFTTALLLSVLMLYNSGKLTSEKMQLQNAADATAYSVSLLEARDLNFTAYTNRAMIGNEIAIAQLVGLYSWFDMLGSTLEFFEYYVLKPLDALAAGTLGILSPVLIVLRAIKAAIKTGIGVVKKGIRITGKLATQAVAAINLAYSYAQQGMHTVVTGLLIPLVISHVIKDNASGAKLSDFGFFSLGAHLSSYFIGPASFVRHNSKNAKDDLSQFMRRQYAATLNGSRDEFSFNRDSDGDGLVDNEGGSSFALFSMPKVSVSVDLALLRGGASFDMGIDLLRRGGTDLRYKEQAGKEYYSWTGVDLIGMDFWFALHVFTEIYVPFHWETLLDLNISPHLDVPFGIGTGQIAASQGVMRAPGMNSEKLGGNVGDAEYGHAPGDLPVTYNFPSPIPDWGVPMNMQQADSLMYNKHKGLPAFNSVVPLDKMDELKSAHPSFQFVDDLGFMAPYFVIGLVKEKDKIKTSEDILKTKAGKRLNLDNDLQDDELGTIARSEVYFSRPTDSLAAHFNRLDDRTEYGSTYNPFWQARLVDTQISERVIALLFQQKQIWALSGVSFSLPLGIGDFDFNDVLRDLGLI